MSNEAEIIDNPDSTPGAVSTGYQAQNTNMVASRVGEDKTVVEGGTGECTLLISGPADVNGTLYTINSDVTFTLTTAGAYYIHLSGSGDNLSPTIGTATTYPHTFDADKNARYTDTGSYRVLNWVIYYDGTTAYAHRIITPESTKTNIEDLDTFEETWITANGSWTAPRSKYYTIYVTGSGGDSGSATGQQSASGGGGGGATGIKRVWADAGDVWTAAFSGSSGGNTSFTDGVTTLTAQNGYDSSASSSYGTSGASGGVSTSGCDVTLKGSDGLHPTVGTPSAMYIGGAGGSSFFSGNSVSTYGSGAGSAGKTYGGGASGASRNSSGTTAGGTGAIGCIRIIG